MTTEQPGASPALSDQLGLSTERAKLRELAKCYLAWEAAGFPVDDPHDTYPNDLWPAYTGPRQVIALLDEIDRLAANLSALADAWNRRNEQEASSDVSAAVAAERERCAAICDEARAAIWPYHKPEVLNAACTVCENLANRIRGIGA